MAHVRQTVKTKTRKRKIGKGMKKCPRCGNEIIIEDKGLGYDVKCKTNDCIKAEFRGI